MGEERGMLNRTPDLEENRDSKTDTGSRHCAQNTHTQLLNCFSKNKNLIFATAVESAISLLCASVTTCFISKDTERFYPITLASITLSMNLLTRVYMKSKIDERHCLYDFIKKFDLDNKIPQLFRGILFSLIDMFNRASLLHESFHYLGDDVLYANAHPKMSIVSYGRLAVTLPNFSGEPVLSKTGDLVGNQIASGLVSAAGPAINLLSGYIGLILAHLIPDNYSETKMYLRCSAVLPVLCNAYYALSSDDDTNNQYVNDFYNVHDKLGIAPETAFIFMLSSLLLLQTFLTCASAIKNCRQKPEEASLSSLETRLIENHNAENEPVIRLQKRTA